MLPMIFAQNVDKRKLNFKEETGRWKDESIILDLSFLLQKVHTVSLTITVLNRSSSKKYSKAGPILLTLLKTEKFNLSSIHRQVK
jgi:hypothetical protein